MSDNKGPKFQDELRESASKIWLAGLGALAAAQEEGSKLFEELLEKGREVESQGRAQVDEEVERAKSRAETVRRKVSEKVSEVSDSVVEGLDQRVSEVMGRLGVPTREEIQELTKKVQELTAKLDDLSGSKKV